MDGMSFGIGCFMFEAPEGDLLTMNNPKGTYLIQDWAKDTQAALEAIPSIDNTQVIVPTGIREQFQNPLASQALELMEGSPQRLRQGGPFVPTPSNGSISFTVTIPHHVQRRVAYRSESMQSTRFDVDVKFGADFPVTFVSTENLELSPSSAVMIVREFLTEEFEDRAAQTSPIRFSYLGPSPFWADCFVMREPDGDADPFDVDLQPSDGYDVLRFSTSIELASAYQAIQRELMHEAGVFYSIVAEWDLIHINQRLIDLHLDDLVRLQKDRGPIASFRRLTKSGRMTLSLNLHLIQTEQWIKAEQRRARANLREMEPSHPRRILEPWITRELNSSSGTEPTSARMVDLIAAAHARSVEVVSVIGASIGGGVIGAALAAIIGAR